MRKIYQLIILSIITFTSIQAQIQVSYLDSLKNNFSQAEGEDKMRAYQRLYQAYVQMDTSKLKLLRVEGNKYVDQTDQLSPSLKIYYKGKIKSMQAWHLIRDGKMDAALNLYQENIKMSENIKDQNIKNESLALNYRGLGILYGSQGIFTKSSNYLNLATDLFIKAKQYPSASNSLAQLSQNYKELQMLDSALITINQSLKYSDVKKDPQTYFFSIFLKTDLLNMAEAFDSTLILLTTDNMKSIKMLGPVMHSNALLNKAYAMAATGADKKNVYSIIENVEPIANSNSDLNLKLNYKYTISQIAKEFGDYENAMLFNTEFINLKDSLATVRSENKFLEMQAKYEDEVKIAKIASLEKDTQYQQRLMIAGGGIILMLLFSGFLFFKNINQKKKIAESLAAKEKEVTLTKERLFTNITHELRTPLSLIISPLQELAIKNKNKEDLKKVNLALDNSQHLLGLVNQILDWHSLEANVLKNNPTVGELGHAIQKCGDRFIKAIADKNLTMDIEYPEEETHVLLDFDKLEKIINNLITNAIKYSPERKILGIYSKIKNEKIIIEVSDMGVGIPLKEQKNIFERFNRADLIDQKSGYGIGLALVKELTELMNGQISLKSVEGEGTTITLSFPLQKVENQFIKTSTQTKNKSTIFLVEDNFQLRNYIVEFLSNEFNVEAFGSAELAEQKLKEVHPDILLLDVMLPGMDGVDFCKKIKTDPETNHLPILLLTAKSSDQHKIEAFEVGADVWMSKPFDNSELKIQLNNLIQNRRKSQQKYDKEIKISFEKQKQKDIKLGNPFLEKTLNCILENMSDEDLNVESLSKKLGLSRFQFSKKIKSYTNKSAVQFIKEVRLEKAKTLLTNSTKTVSEIAYEVGYKDPNYFSSSFKNYFGKSPTEWRKVELIDD